MVTPAAGGSMRGRGYRERHHAGVLHCVRGVMLCVSLQAFPGMAPEGLVELMRRATMAGQACCVSVSCLRLSVHFWRTPSLRLIQKLPSVMERRQA